MKPIRRLPDISIMWHGDWGYTCRRRIYPAGGGEGVKESYSCVKFNFVHMHDSCFVFISMLFSW